MAPEADASLEQLGARLAALREADHWRCQGDFLELCGMTLEEAEPCVKKWWGNQALWLDMLATEIARGLALGAGLDDGRWVAAADDWLDAAYRRATNGMSCPPPQPILRNKARPLVDRVLRDHGADRDQVAALSRYFRPVPVATLTCGSCGQAFSQRLGQCPACFPRAPPPDKSSAAAGAQEDAWESLPSASIEEGLAWHQAERLAWRDGNSGGVFVLQLPSGAVCVKGGACAVAEVFAQRLAGALGVRAAAARVVPAASEENWAIRKAMRTNSSGDEELSMQVKMKLSRSALAVVEFINGSVLMGLPANRLLRQAEADGGAPHGTWRQLGRLMALDMLLNNLDRLPLAWTNDGNLGNVMIGSRQGDVVGIDQSVHPILHPEGLQRYLGRVREAALEARDGAGGHFGAVAAAILTNTGVQLAADEVRSLRGGCLELLREVARQEASGELEQALTSVSAESLRAFADVEEFGGDIQQAGQENGRRVATFCRLVRDVASVAKRALAEAPSCAGRSP